MTTGIVRDRSEKLGFPPGSLIFVGEQKTDNVVLTVSNYDVERFEEKTAASIEDCLSYRDLPSTTWIHVCGLHMPDIIESLGRCYGIHHLFLEDILNTAQRPKMEDYGDYLYIVLKALLLNNGRGDEVESEQISLILKVVEETVARHIKQACERYGVNKRTYLVILTLFDGTLTFSDIFRRRYYPFPE